MNRYITLLKNNQILQRLSTIQLISYFGAWFSNVAIYTLLLNMNVVKEVIAFVAMLHFIAGVLQTPFSGSIIDRLQPKKLMLSLIFIEVISTFLLIFIQTQNDLSFLYILIFIKMAAASFYFTTEMSLLPKILNHTELQIANELHSIIWSFSYTLGMALSGFIVYLLGVKSAFLLDTLMFIVAFFLLANLQLYTKTSKHKKSFFIMIQEVFSYLQQNPKAFHLMLVHAFVGISAFDALVALIVNQYYYNIIAISLAIGLLHSSRAVGLVIGPIFLSKYLSNATLPYIFFAQALSIYLWAISLENFYLSLLASVVVGLFTTTLWSYTYTLLQQNIEEKFYGRIIAYNDMFFLLSATLTSFSIGYLATHNFSLTTITIFLGNGFIVGGLYFKFVSKKFHL